MATSPVETVATSHQLTRRDGLKLSAERVAYCFGATASDLSPASVDLDQQELCRGNLFCAQYPQISPGGQPAVASFLAPFDGGDIAHQANTMNPLLREIRHAPSLWMLIFVPIVIAARIMPAADALLFVLAVVPLAALLSHATEACAICG